MVLVANEVRLQVSGDHFFVLPPRGMFPPGVVLKTEKHPFFVDVPPGGRVLAKRKGRKYASPGGV